MAQTTLISESGWEAFGFAIARSDSDEAIHATNNNFWIASLRSH